jgi:hypothetical protein
MSEYIKTDIGEYLVSRTGNFEKSPPDDLWKHIEEKIPTYSVFNSNNTLIKYLIGGISLSAIIIAFLIIYFKPFSPPENISGTSIKSDVHHNNGSQAINKTAIESKNLVKTTLVSTENIASKKEVLLKETSEKKENAAKAETLKNSDKSVTYSINASGLKNVNAISFVNDKNETVLVSKNPAPNTFGFYVIDISQLAKGTYNIMISTSEGTKLHKRETFK